MGELKKTIEQMAEEITEWGFKTFPNDGIEFVMRKLEEEQEELAEAVSNYLGPWSDLDGDFSPDAAAKVGQVRLNDLLDEVADNVIVLIRLLSLFQADLREVLENKWDIVKLRDYSRYLEPKEASNDDRTINERLSFDKRYVIVWDVGPGFYLASEPVPNSIAHWTSSFKNATKFTAEEASNWLVAGRLIDEKGKKYEVASVGPIVVREVEVDAPYLTYEELKAFTTSSSEPSEAEEVARLKKGFEELSKLYVPRTAAYVLAQTMLGGGTVYDFRKEQ